MARFHSFTLALALAAAIASASVVQAQEALPPGFYDRPVLVVDPGRHTAPIYRADADAAGRMAATASRDKTVRLWSQADGTLLRTIRLPAGPGEIGQARAVALDPAGALVAASGWTGAVTGDHQIYLYDTTTGALLHRIPGLPKAVSHLTFSRDGRFLAATVSGGHGLRVFDRERGWAEALRDTDYGGGDSYGAAFASDGRLATTGNDGLVRLYPPDLTGAPLRQRNPGGAHPYGLAFSADGAHLAVGYGDSWQVDVLDGQSLALLFSTETRGIDNGDLGTVAWSADDTLLAGGRYTDDAGMSPVLTWAAAGRGTRHRLPAGQDTVMTLVPLPGSDLLVGAQDPFLARLTPEGRTAWSLPSPLADFRDQRSTLSISADGAAVAFGYARGGKSTARFDLARLALEPGAGPDPRTAPPRQEGLPIEGWENTTRPTLAGALLPLEPFEVARSLALSTGSDRFVLGTDWSLRAFDARGRLLWRQPVPGIAWAVNVTGDGRLVVVAYGDGTIRWHRMDDGREILAFMPFADRANWVAWTPEGFYASSPGAHSALRWHVNQPGWQPAQDFAVSDIPGFYRPEAIRLVLREMETPRAIGLALLAEQRHQVQIRTRSRVPPGAKLHWLAVGVSLYNEKYARHLRLHFAEKDARDLATALNITQNQLWVAGSQQTLRDEDATRSGVLRALNTLRSAFTGPDDLAVVHFSGHGAMVDGRLYLLPYEVDARDAVTIRTTAISLDEFRQSLTAIAGTGRVLLLLDACYSGNASLDGAATLVNSDRLAQEVALPGLNILTSSSSSERSREDPAWGNGAFTSIVLRAIGGAADGNKDGFVSANEFAEYVLNEVPNLTNGSQRPRQVTNFGGTLFAVR